MKEIIQFSLVYILSVFIAGCGDDDDTANLDGDGGKFAEIAHAVVDRDTVVDLTEDDFQWEQP